MILAINDKVIIRPVVEPDEVALIATVKVRKDTLLMGEVMHVVDSDIKVGDIVLYSGYGYEEWEDMVIVTKDMIYARVSEAN